MQVVGAGPAGLAASTECAVRGHDVTLFEEVMIFSFVGIRICTDSFHSHLRMYPSTVDGVHFQTQESVLNLIVHSAWICTSENHSYGGCCAIDGAHSSALFCLRMCTRLPFSFIHVSTKMSQVAKRAIWSPLNTEDPDSDCSHGFATKMHLLYHSRQSCQLSCITHASLVSLTPGDYVWVTHDRMLEGLNLPLNCWAYTRTSVPLHQVAWVLIFEYLC
jgi:hypothetical protein